MRTTSTHCRTFPAPGRPTMATISPAFTSKLSLFSTKGSSGRYRRLTFSNTNWPRGGHCAVSGATFVRSNRSEDRSA